MAANINERVHLIRYDEFFDKYLTKNRLCVFSSALTKTWKSRKEWVTLQGQPNLDFLAEHFGEATVPVADCSQEYFSSHCKEDMKLKDFLKYWQNKNSLNYNDLRCLYLKDWHFCKTFPEYEAYKTPLYFTSDWLNEFWDQHDASDDYRFVYMGPKGSWTPFHADVFRSFSWSANICGRKKWIIFPPGQERFLLDKLGNLPYDVTSDEVINDQTKYPEFSKASKPIIIIQEEGEVMFVPSGWHHQVINLEDTISINHNWINACGIERMWNHLKTELNKVQLSIEDCRDMEGWDEHCQVILKATSGMDYAGFLRFLCTVATPRIECLLRAIAEQKRCVPDRDESSKELITTGTAGSNSTTADKAAVTPGTEESNQHLPRSLTEWIQTTNIEDRERHSFVDYCRFDLLKVSECLCELEADQSFSGLPELTSVDLQQTYQRIQDILCDARKVFGILQGF